MRTPRTTRVKRPATRQLDAKNVKILLFTGAFVLSATVIFYTQFLVNQLRAKEERTIALYADIFRYYLSESTNPDDMAFYMDRVLPTINFPMIQADEQDEPMQPYSSFIKNIELPPDASMQQQHTLLKSYMSDMLQTYQPIVLHDTRGKVITKIYYTNSDIVRQLMFFPYIEIFVVGTFVFIGYIAFNYFRTSEQSSVWVGLAKEAAHQLGTPLSSMLAWLEILKLDADNPVQVVSVAEQMQQDVERLNKIAHRFSKIGSKPEMREENISHIVQNVIEYFDSRLPNLGKTIKIKRNIQRDVTLTINSELFEWVIENLIKNAADAMESTGGTIDILLEQQQFKTVILVCDTGKGMTQKVKREVFKPGFSTKKRGWGLGLSLCKRIIEDYHEGKIYVKDTAPGKGTVFAIEFPVKSAALGVASHQASDLSIAQLQHS
jgi:anti-sigma regulatory factor (Ser/Thr protein kinase)